MKHMKRFFLAAVTAMSMTCGIFLVPAWCESSVLIAENMELKTYRNRSVGGNLRAYGADPERLQFLLTTEPVKGQLELEEDGSFVYTPKEGKKGRDYFGYKVKDEEGNLSQEATVIIRIEKPEKEVLYWDMEGRAEEYAAVELCERELFTGEEINGRHYFQPEETVSRGMFLSLCMEISGKAQKEPVLKTGYADDSQLNLFQKQAAVSAISHGVFSGRSTQAGPVFAPNQPITREEAAILLNRAISPTPVTYLFLQQEQPQEAIQAWANLNGCEIWTKRGISQDALTRAEMALMLSEAIRVVESR